MLSSISSGIICLSRVGVIVFLLSCRGMESGVRNSRFSKCEMEYRFLLYLWWKIVELGCCEEAGSLRGVP